jgi:hypothetical protein
MLANAGEYDSAMHRAVPDGWLEAHPSGAYVKLKRKRKVEIS